MSRELTFEQKNQLDALNRAEDGAINALDNAVNLVYVSDLLWMATAKMDVQKGFMAARRSVCEGKRVGDK